MRLRASGVARALALAVFCVVAITPFLYVISTSLKHSRVLYNYPPHWIPSPLYFGNYVKLITQYPFLRWAGNTLFVASVVTATKLLIDSMAAYALARMEFVGRRAVLGAMAATIMVPPALLIIPLFFLVRDAGLLDTYWALILPPLANPVGVFILRAFIRGIPDELEHAARVDDANPWQVYWHVILPAIRPGLVVVASYVFLLEYVDFVWPLVATQSDSKLMLSTGLATLKPRTINVDWGLTSAASVLSMVPITAVFLVFQRRLIGGSLAAGLKG